MCDYHLLMFKTKVATCFKCLYSSIQMKNAHKYPEQFVANTTLIGYHLKPVNAA